MNVSAKDIASYIEKTDADRKLVKVRAGELSAENDRLRKEAGEALKLAQRHAAAVDELKQAKAEIVRLDKAADAYREQVRALEQKVASFQARLAEADSIAAAFKKLTSASARP